MECLYSEHFVDFRVETPRCSFKNMTGLTHCSARSNETVTYDRIVEKFDGYPTLRTRTINSIIFPQLRIRRARALQDYKFIFKTHSGPIDTQSDAIRCQPQISNSIHPDVCTRTHWPSRRLNRSHVSYSLQLRNTT